MKRDKVRLHPVRTAGARQLEKRLVAYALAAAGVGACAKPASAEVVYTQTKVTLLYGRLPIDLNHDGVADFTLQFRTVAYSSSTYLDKLGVHGGAGAAVIGQGQNGQLAAWDAPQSWSIGPSSPKGFVGVATQSAAMDSAGGLCCLQPRGAWQSAKNKYLGLKFLINGEVHYGWARLTVSSVGDVIKMTVNGYAYESTPNQAILAGDRGGKAKATCIVEPPGVETGPSLSVLGLGAPALDMWRRNPKGF